MDTIDLWNLTTDCGSKPSRHKGGHARRLRRGDLIKMIWWDGQGACLFSKRLERGRFVWPSASEGKVSVTPAQLSMLLEGIDWRAPVRTWRPLAAGVVPPGVV